MCSVVLPFKLVSLTVKYIPAPFLFNFVSVFRCSSIVPCSCLMSFLLIPLSQKFEMYGEFRSNLKIFRNVIDRSFTIMSYY